MRNWLRNAPMEFTGKKPLLLQMPDAAGQMRQFEVWESPVMAPELMAKYPGIRTYSAKPTDGSGDVVRLGVGHKGFYAFQFRTEADIETLCPYAEGQDAYYMAYRLADLPNDAPAGVLECGVQDGEGHVSLNEVDSPEKLREHFAADRNGSADTVQLKKYRAAISAKGEYSKFHGNTKPLVLSAMVTAMNFIAAIMERDFSLRIELVANNDTLIYLDAATDPYEGTEVFDWMEQNQAVVTSLIGSANFDIGHVFSVYVDGSAVGVAGGRVCNNGNKARACSSATSPNAAYFYLVTAHEMCHQMTGDHTWNTCTVDLIPQRRPASTMEPGSGSTIMSYAGSCGANNVQSSKDPYFNVRSIDQVRQFYTTGSGTCGSSVGTDNSKPEVTITSPNNVYIPILTPFQLHASATDADAGDKLTYCWEQHDNGPEIPLGEQVKNSALFRSYTPSASTSRYFPRLQNILTNSTSKAELLPDSTRQLNFRFTARDNHPGGGGQTWASIRLNSTLAAGPFVVTSPNKNTDIWYGGENRIVTWDVANTDKAPVNCQTVNILLSTDNANTYEFVLAAGVPNNGTCCVKVPDIVDNLCRIRVEGVGNVFFDLSNAAFKIKAAEKPGFTICTPLSQQVLCLPNADIDVDVSSALGFSTPVLLTASGLPAGGMATFTPNPAVPGTPSKLSLQFPNGQPEETFNLTIVGTADTLSSSVSTQISLIFNDFSSVALQTPANGTSGAVQSPTLTWGTAPDANTYEVQVATSPSFEASTLKAASTGLTAGSFQVPVLLEKSGVYYWRIRPVNECGPAAWTEPFVFGTVVESCGTFSANDLPKVISASGTPLTGSFITLNAGGSISDVNVKSVQGNHTFFKDLELTLQGPDGTSVALSKDKCAAYNGQFKFGFDDESALAFSCPPSSGAAFKPAAPLSAFKGKDAAGAWTLWVKDNVSSSGGNLAGFELEICSSVALTPPFIVTNNTLELPAGANALIANTLLKAEDANNSATQLTYTLVTVPKYGELQINAVAALPGAQFSQADLDNGVLRYFDFGSGNGGQFRFVVTDGEGGFVESTFVIKAAVGAFEPTSRLAFDIAPNPATESLHLLFGENLSSDARVSMFNTAGQQLRNVTLPSGTLTYLLDVANLPDGVYIVTVQNERASGVRKVVVRH